MRQTPNILSAVRILLSFLLLVLAKDTTLFLIVCFIIGISDVLDRWLARSLHVQNELGARLDSIGDLTFYCTSLYIVLFQTGLKIVNLISILVLCVFALKLAVLLLTEWKYHTQTSMHTMSSKLTGLLLFLLVPLCMVTESLSLIPVILVIACPYLAVSEEVLPILSRNTYDINMKSLLKKWEAGLQFQRRLSGKKKTWSHRAFFFYLIREDLPIRIQAFFPQMLNACTCCSVSIKNGFPIFIGRESTIYTSSLFFSPCIRTSCTLWIRLYLASFI